MDSKIFREAALAYQAVYDEELRQEIEEQQDFENWVNSLVEEGHDLSEYTWEEMYEEYLVEVHYNVQGAQTAIRNRNAALGWVGNQARRLANATIDSFKTDRHPTKGKDTFPATSSNPARPRQSALAGRVGNTNDIASLRRGQEQARQNQLAAASRGTSPTPPRNTGGSTPPRNTGGSGSAPAANRPAASAPTAKPTPTPSASAPAKPTPAPSTPAEKPSAMDQWAKANPRLAQAQQIRKQGGSRAEVNKALYNKGTAAATSTPTVVKAGFDLFDVVKGYLIDEGFAETEQAAIAIMANMSEEWKLEIIDEAVKGESSDRRRALAAERRKGIKPLPAKEGEKYASHKISQMAYTKRAKMGDDD